MSLRSGRSEPKPAVRRKTSQGWVIGRIGGAPVLLAPSWFLIAIVLAVFFYPSVTAHAPGTTIPVAVLVSLSFALLLCLSVFLHELAHGQVARALGIPVRSYVINLWGGHTQFDSDVKTPGVSALVSVVGPLINGIIALFGFAASSLISMPGIVYLLLIALSAANAFVAFFNILPGLPLDGGRVLEALVWAIGGKRATGTIAAAWAGRFVGIALVLGFLIYPILRGEQINYVGVAWAVLIGWYLWNGAGQALRYAKTTRIIESLSAVRLAHSATTISASASVAQAEFETGRAGVDFAVIVTSNGRPIGYLDPVAAGSVPLNLRDSTAASSAAIPIPDGAYLSESLVGEAFLDVARQLSAISPVVVVVSESVVPQVHGLLWLQDVATEFNTVQRSG